MNLRRLERPASDGRRRDLDVVEESVEDAGRGVADVAAELALDARRDWLHREPIHVACQPVTPAHYSPRQAGYQNKVSP